MNSVFIEELFFSVSVGICFPNEKLVHENLI